MKPGAKFAGRYEEYVYIGVILFWKLFISIQGVPKVVLLKDLHGYTRINIERELIDRF